MNLEQNCSPIEACFENYEKTQAHHLNLLKSETVPDLGLMTREREMAFQILKSSLENVMKNAGLSHGSDSASKLSKYENRLNSIMTLDEEISIEIKKYRDSLKTHLNQIKKGKTAMNGYRTAGTNSPDPYVLSMNS